jgi:hypothetical protein
MAKCVEAFSAAPRHTALVGLMLSEGVESWRRTLDSRERHCGLCNGLSGNVTVSGNAVMCFARLKRAKGVAPLDVANTSDPI